MWLFSTRVLASQRNEQPWWRSLGVGLWLICGAGSISAWGQNNLDPQCVSFNLDIIDVAGKKSSRVEDSPFEALQGKTIRNIRLQQLTIFDENNPEENNSAYRLLNRLHSKTRGAVVTSQLLFKVGDSINHKVIEETARNLRTRKYFTNAYVLPETVCGDQVDLVVITQDAWAIEPQFSYSHKSSDNQTGFAISDSNLFGTGNAFALGYSNSQRRSSVSYDFSNPYFLNRPIALEALYEDASDGRNSLVSISHPFYSLDTPWASGLKVSDLAQVEEIRSRGQVTNAFRHQALEDEVYYGLATSITHDFTQRWLVGFSREQELFFANSDTRRGLPETEKLAYPWIEYQYAQNSFGVFKNLHQIQRPEDLDLGQIFTLRLGFSGTDFGNLDDVLRYKGHYVNIVDLADKHILEFELQLDGRQHLEANRLNPNLLTSSLSYHYLEDDKNRWYARLEYGVGEDLPEYKELTLGDITGLRGYPTDYLRGSSRALLTLERRYFSEVHLFNLLRLGGVVFFDAGKAWGLPHEPYAPLLSNVGIGLRLSSSKVKIGKIIHIDLAMPTSAHRGLSRYQLTLGAYQTF